MAFVPAPGITAITLDWLIDQQPGVNTFHYDTGHLDPADVVAFCEQVWNYVEAHWLANINSLTQFIRVRGRALDSSADSEGQFAGVGTFMGEDASDGLPNNVTWAVKRSTGLSGKHNRGRVYWVGLATNMLDEINKMSGARGGAIIGNLNGMLTALAAAPFPGSEVLLDRKTGAHVPVTEYVATDYFLDSQRRRLPGHNIHH